MLPSPPAFDTHRPGDRLHSRNGMTALLVLVAILALACTDNPFEDSSTITAAGRSISGVVQLQGRVDHGGVRIVLEGFNISVLTDAQGAFTLRIPTETMKSGAGEISGVFALYAFLGNFTIDSIRVAVHKGSLVLPSERLDEQGRLRTPMVLRERFSMDVQLSPASIDADSARTIMVSTVLNSGYTSDRVYFPRRLGNVEGPMLLVNESSGEIRITPSTVTGIELSDNIQLGGMNYSRTQILLIPKHTLTAGRYLVIPYILASPDRMPAALPLSLGMDVRSFGPGYRWYPMLRGGGVLSVR